MPHRSFASARRNRFGMIQEHHVDDRRASVMSMIG